LGNSHGNFQLHRFITSENIAKSFRGVTFFDSHCIYICLDDQYRGSFDDTILLQSCPALKKFWKLVKILQNYSHNRMARFLRYSVYRSYELLKLSSFWPTVYKVIT